MPSTEPRAESRSNRAVELHGRADPLDGVARCPESCEELLAVLLVARRNDELDLGLERARRPPLAVMVDGDDVATSDRDEVEDASQLARPVGDEQANSEEATGAREPVP
jgi:hypothetical protein